MSRRLTLHVSALSDDEYSVYTPALADICGSDSDDYELITIGVREARAWMRGRFSSSVSADIDTILKFFHPNLAQTDTLTGGQFFAAMRLVIHVLSGKQPDRSLAFVQAYPEMPPQPSSYLPPPPQRLDSSFTKSQSRRSPSPPKRSQSPLSTLGSQYSEEQYSKPAPLPPPFRRAATAAKGHHHSSSISESTPAPSTNPFFATVRSSPSITNPFLTRTKSLNSHISATNSPPLPPRTKAVPPLPTAHIFPPASPPKLASMKPVIPPKPTSFATKFTPLPHATSTLMRQSLLASKTAQTMKRAEENLAKERIVDVLRSTSRNRSTSPDKRKPPPPLPQRRDTMKQSQSSEGSSSMSSSSLERVASARYRSRSKGSSPVRYHDDDFLSSPPPVHPDRYQPHMSSPQMHSAFETNAKKPDSFESIYGTRAVNSSSDEGPVSPRTLRTKSLHGPPVPLQPPPPSRRRPESHVGSMSRHVSLGSNSTGKHTRMRSASGSTNATSKSIPEESNKESTNKESNIARTLAKLDSSYAALELDLGSKFEAARFKAEAGLSKRGFVPSVSGKSLMHKKDGDGKGYSGEGLLGEYRTENSRLDSPVDVELDSARDSDEEDSRLRTREGTHRSVERDDMKWPATGGGWKPL